MTRIGCVLTLVFIAISAVLVRALWHIVPRLATELDRTAKEPRIIVPRSDLASYEQTTIAIFEAQRAAWSRLPRPVAWWIAGPAMPATGREAAARGSSRTRAGMG